MRTAASVKVRTWAQLNFTTHDTCSTKWTKQGQLSCIVLTGTLKTECSMYLFQLQMCRQLFDQRPQFNSIFLKIYTCNMLQLCRRVSAVSFCCRVPQTLTSVCRTRASVDLAPAITPWATTPVCAHRSTCKSMEATTAWVSDWPNCIPYSDIHATGYIWLVFNMAESIISQRIASVIDLLAECVMQLEWKYAKLWGSWCYSVHPLSSFLIKD